MVGFAGQFDGSRNFPGAAFILLMSALSFFLVGKAPMSGGGAEQDSGWHRELSLKSPLRGRKN